MSDIHISIETAGEVTDDKELAWLFGQTGDEFFHQYIEDATFHAEVPDVAPGSITLTLDRRDGGRLEGMMTEANLYLTAEEWTRNVQVSEVPTDEDIEQAIDEADTVCERATELIDAGLGPNEAFEQAREEVER